MHLQPPTIAAEHEEVLLRTILVVVVVLDALAIYGYLSWSVGAPVYEETERMRAIGLPLRFRNWDEHDAIVAATHPQPYILEIDAGPGSLVLAGTPWPVRKMQRNEG